MVRRMIPTLISQLRSAAIRAVCPFGVVLAMMFVVPPAATRAASPAAT